MKQVAKVITLRNEASIQSERDVFYTKLGGFDTHQNSGSDLNNLLGEVDLAIQDIREEMQAHNLWENITVVTLSDFGRCVSVIPIEPVSCTDFHGCAARCQATALEPTTPGRATI
jgi:uncharacterized protein (DUF1501 family)